MRPFINRSVGRDLRICLLAVSILMSGNELSAQPTYPLATGNIWHYWIYSALPLPPVPYTITVIGDTVMPNGKRYAIYDNPDMFGQRYIRSESSYVYYWTYNWYDSTWSEKRIFNLLAPFGEVDTITWAGFLTVTANEPIQETIFERSTNFRTFGLGGIIFAEITLADGFGFTQYQYWGDYPDLQARWSLDGCIISGTAYGAMVGVRPSHATHRETKLFPNFPNPFNPSTSISFSIPTRTHVTLTIYNVLGHEVARLVDEEKTAGNYSVEWHPADASSGVYFYRLNAGKYVETKKMVLLR